MLENILLSSFDYKEKLVEQRELFIECFPENIGTKVVEKNHYLWKFQSFPNITKSYEYSAEDDSKIIGYYAALPYTYNYYGREIIVGMVCDVMTGIKARGKGIFTKLGLYATEELSKAGLAFTTGYPIRPEVIPGHLKVGWEIEFELPLYIKMLNATTLLANKGLSIITPVVNASLRMARYLLSNFGKKVIEHSVYDHKELYQIDEFPEFINRWENDYNIVLRKSLDFLVWRLGSPDKDYHIHIFKNPGSNCIIASAITTFTRKEGVECMAILDLMIPTKETNYSNSVHEALERFALKNHKDSIIIMCSKIIARKYKLLNNFYLKSPFIFYFITKVLSDKIDRLSIKDPKNWHLMWIDSDDL